MSTLKCDKHPETEMKVDKNRNAWCPKCMGIYGGYVKDWPTQQLNEGVSMSVLSHWSEDQPKDDDSIGPLSHWNE